jgi:DNA polymerase sigma
LEKAKIILENAQKFGEYWLLSKRNDISLMFSATSPNNEATMKAQISINDRSPLIWELIQKYCECDSRLPNLIKFLICWGTRRGIVNPEEGYFSSQSLILLLIFFLQIMSRPVLPSLHDEIRIQNCRQLTKNMVNYEETERTYTPGKKYREEVKLLGINYGWKNVDCSKWRTENHESEGLLLLRFFYYYGIDYVKF